MNDSERFLFKLLKAFVSGSEDFMDRGKKARRATLGELIIEKVGTCG